MSPFTISPELSSLAERLRPTTRPWRAQTIAIDGVDHSGKSTLSRFLAWQLGMPTIETDLAFVPGDGPPSHDRKLVERLVKMRHNMDRPVIVEGVFVLRLLAGIGIYPEVLVRAECTSRPRPGSWPETFAEYVASHPRAAAPDHIYSW